jgi:AcrR family transcriptional regulator
MQRVTHAPARRGPKNTRRTPRTRRANGVSTGRGGGAARAHLLAPAPGTDQRSRLLHAAARVFAKGFGQASVAAIVKEAGTSRRTFYEQFDDLTDALIQLYDAAACVLLQAVESAFQSGTGARARLTAALDAYATGIATNADLARIIYSEIRAAGPDQARRHQKTLTRFAALLGEWAKSARAERLVPRLPDELTVWAALTGIEGVAMRYVYEGDEEKLVALVPRLVELVLKAFR